MKFNGGQLENHDLSIDFLAPSIFYEVKDEKNIKDSIRVITYGDFRVCRISWIFMGYRI